jgi:tetratricopeptide (TPR) repeat protein/TolB-like protein
MSSIISGYEYDIFISYRQKDNKLGGWVTEFMQNLKGELESTFKEEVSVYYDTNPHDGLLETHDVGASLKDKLKCLVFIPIISRTYCDPKSFAWEHEFRAFVDLASQDHYGLKIKLPYGNVSNRVLPVRIHDLDREDINLCETVLGSTLRGVEFIYKEPGVNRALTPKDDERKNLNGTIYRNQINKVALAVKEIIQALKTNTERLDSGDNHQVKPSDVISKIAEKRRKLKSGGFIRKYLPAAVGIAILLIAFILIRQKFFSGITIEKLRSSGDRISVAVMPFRNMTNDSTLNIWQDGIQLNLVASLSNYAELRVMQPESTNNLIQSKGYVNYAQITPSVARKISQKLDANVFVYGNISRTGEKLRISAQLLDSKSGEIFKSFQLDGDVKNILPLTDSISLMIKSYLILSTLRKEITPEFQLTLPNSVDAFKSFVLGYKAFIKWDTLSALRFFTQSLESDSTFITSYIWMALTYENLGEYKKAEKWCLKVYDRRDQLPFETQIWANWLYARYHEKSKIEEINYAKQLLEMDDRGPIRHWLVGIAYFDMHQYTNAIPELEKMLEIYKSWNTKPMNAGFYDLLIAAYHNTGNNKNEKKLLKRAFKDFPDDPQLIRRQAIISLYGKDTVSANRCIERFFSLHQSDSWSEASIANRTGEIYDEAGYYKRAEVFFRKALSLEPDNPGRLNNLGYYLVDRDINLAEGLELSNKAVKSDPNNYKFLDSEGWGLFKLGKNKEALKLLEKSDSLKPVYNYELSLHLEAVRKAIVNYK